MCCFEWHLQQATCQIQPPLFFGCGRGRRLHCQEAQEEESAGRRRGDARDRPSTVEVRHQAHGLQKARRSSVAHGPQLHDTPAKSTVSPKNTGRFGFSRWLWGEKSGGAHVLFKQNHQQVEEQFVSPRIILSAARLRSVPSSGCFFGKPQKSKQPQPIHEIFRKNIHPHVPIQVVRDCGLLQTVQPTKSHLVWLSHDVNGSQ